MRRSQAAVALALVSGTLAYGVSAATLLDAGLSTVALFLTGVAALAVLLRFMPRHPAPPGNAVGWGEALLRMAATTALGVGLTSAAAALGPGAAGAAASFPLIGASIAVFAQLGPGQAAGVAVMRGMASALYAFAVFFLIVSFATTRMPLAASFGLATVGALIAQAATLRFLRPAQKERRGRWGAAASSPNRG